MTLTKGQLEKLDFETLEDGFLYFFPCKDRGGFSAANLRDIAKYLDQKNKAQEDRIEEYFRNNKKGL